MEDEHQACLLLGSNIQPERNIPLAVAQLGSRMRVMEASSVWQSAAIGSPGPDFLNSALMVFTALGAEALKEEVLRPLEAQMGRVRSQDKNAPRPIDIDIIFFDGVLLDPALWDRAHMAVPVADLLPGYRSRSGESLQDAALRLRRTTRITERKDVSILPDPWMSNEGGARPADALEGKDE